MYLCNSCGLCCKLFYINLSEKEYRSGRFRTIFSHINKIDDFKLAKSCGANLLTKKENGECVYLKGNRCRIHADRPEVCRSFYCTSKAKRFQEMIKIINQARSEQ